MSRPLFDLCALGARALPTRALVQLLLPRVDDADIDAAVAALRLPPAARAAALRDVRGGARVLAAVELGRRAWLVPHPTAARVNGPSDVVAALGPRLVDDTRTWAVALDPRGCIARIAPVDDDVTSPLQLVLGAGCRRVILVRRVEGPASPAPAFVEVSVACRHAGRLVGVDVVDAVVLGDDGWVSFVRLGLLVGDDARYR